MTQSHDTGLFLKDLDSARPSVVETPWGTLAIYRVRDRWVAADAWCPHMLGPLHQGTRCGSEVTCPWHAWRFDLSTGRRTDDPRDRDPADRVVGDDASRITVTATHVDADGRLWIERPVATR
ncbi:MAG: Rieske 2Fe-2S domain-containing protein [Planctomycetes bacterium]|nr:Rieske 2Fe-2S domain-containing protein [Planctomycetota bacterium]MCB9905102.1 Rieske 2Fe-2S domain-containing protein [Planctomycetota bacterium]